MLEASASRLQKGNTRRGLSSRGRGELGYGEPAGESVSAWPRPRWRVAGECSAPLLSAVFADCLGWKRRTVSVALPDEHGYRTGHARLVLETIVVGYLASSILVTNMR